MNVYTTDKIRNVVLLGHSGAGKTALAESMAYLAGITSRMGKTEDKNTISDYGKEEQNFSAGNRGKYQEDSSGTWGNTTASGNNARIWSNNNRKL